MIETTLTELALTLIALTFLAITLSAGSTRLSEALRRTRIANKSLSCRVCSFVWAPKRKEKRPRCPHCGRANRRGRDRRLN